MNQRHTMHSTVMRIPGLAVWSSAIEDLLSSYQPDAQARDKRGRERDKSCREKIPRLRALKLRYFSCVFQLDFEDFDSFRAHKSTSWGIEPSKNTLFSCFRQLEIAQLQNLRVGLMLVLIWLFIACFSSVTFAKDKLKQLSIETASMQPSVSLGRPMLTWWDVKISGSGLVVGQLEFIIKSNENLLATFVTDELTLNGPEQRIRVLLPAINSSLFIDQLQVDISFRGKNFSGSLGEQVLRIPFATTTSSKKVFTVLVGESRIARKRSPQREQVIDRLRFENLIFKGTRPDDDERDYVKTIFPSIDPGDFPAEPLAYCGYDMVVLMAEEFRNLRKPQLEGLLAWVKAGGSFYVEPNGVMEQFHVDFLRKLVADDPREPVVQVDSEGKLFKGLMPHDKVALAVDCGIGHVAIRMSDSDQNTDFTADAWRNIIVPLWHARTQPLAMPGPPRHKVGPNGQAIFLEGSTNDPWDLSLSIFDRFHLSQAELLERLMPEGVRMIPLPLLALILFVFVAVIGPGDYFLLGWLRARKFTWVTFPMATFGVAAFTVLLSNHYMSATEARRSVMVCDVSNTGEIVRTNRFELLYLASTRRVTTEIQKALFSQLSFGMAYGSNSIVVNGQVVSSGGFAVGSDGQVSAASTYFQGRIPTQFYVLQDLAKWTPQLNRAFTIPNAPSQTEADWSDFNLDSADLEDIQRHVMPTSLAAAGKQHFGPKAMVACFSGPDGWAYDRSPQWRSARPLDSARENEIAMNAFNLNNVRSMNPLAIGGSSSVAEKVPYEAGLFRWIYQASVAPSMNGIFKLTNQATPRGGASCEDLPILDSSDSGAWLLAVVVPENDEILVYRKLMRFEDSGPKMAEPVRIRIPIANLDEQQE